MVVEEEEGEGIIGHWMMGLVEVDIPMEDEAEEEVEEEVVIEIVVA